jgi:hypothetical protein
MLILKLSPIPCYLHSNQSIKMERGSLCTFIPKGCTCQNLILSPAVLATSRTGRIPNSISSTHIDQPRHSNLTVRQPQPPPAKPTLPTLTTQSSLRFLHNIYNDIIFKSRFGRRLQQWNQLQSAVKDTTFILCSSFKDCIVSILVIRTSSLP